MRLSDRTSPRQAIDLSIDQVRPTFRSAAQRSDVNALA
jgi:hypothetical protein